MIKQLTISSRDMDSPYRKIELISDNIISVELYYEKTLCDVNLLIIAENKIDSIDYADVKKYRVFISAPNGEYSDIIPKIRRKLSFDSNVSSILSKYHPDVASDENTVLIKKHTITTTTEIIGMKMVSSEGNIILSPIRNSLLDDKSDTSSYDSEVEAFKSFIETYIFDTGIQIIPTLVQLFGRPHEYI